MRNHCKQLSPETLELTHREGTEEGRTNLGRDVWQEQLRTGEGAVGTREIIEFLSQKLETSDLLEFSLLNNKAARPLRHRCRSGR